MRKTNYDFIIIAALTPQSNCTNGEARLVGGAISNKGRIEICINQIWGTVCDDGWDYLDANVVCKQLGHQHFGKEYIVQTSCMYRNRC